MRMHNHHLLLKRKPRREGRAREQEDAALQQWTILTLVGMLFEKKKKKIPDERQRWYKASKSIHQECTENTTRARCVVEEDRKKKGGKACPLVFNACPVPDPILFPLSLPLFSRHCCTSS